MRNLTEVSLNNRSLVWYFIVMIAVFGIFSYIRLGRMEDPNFTIRQMVVTVAWPGATAEEMSEQVTDKLEKKLQDTPHLKHITSESRAGTAIIYVILDDTLATEDIRPTWRYVRNFCEDIKKDFPAGVYGPYYNDRFDDVFGSIYALTGDGFSYEEMRREAENIRQMLLSVENVQKVELVGVQKEKIYVEIERAKLTELGITPQSISSAIESQNNIAPAAKVETSSDNVFIRVTGTFKSVDDIKNLPIAANGRSFRLADIAQVERRFTDPAEPKMFFNGEQAIGIAVSMESGGNILDLGKNLSDLMENAQEELPVGLKINQVSDQPKVVDASINEFVKTLAEAVIIVLAVSFITLGIRTGLVVAGCIPLVLLGVFCAMSVAGIDLHKVSLGTLIISLGLLVDDAIIAVEMMSVQLEKGIERFKAACFAFDATAKPMLTGTLITCAGFIPVAFSDGLASEFCKALFPVIGISLVLSWIVSVMVAPLYGYHLIKVKPKTEGDNEDNLYKTKFYNIFRKILSVCLLHRRLVIGVTVLIFCVSVYAMKFVKQEFFPASIRPEIILEMTLPNGASIAATEAEAERMAKFLETQKEDIENYSYYVGKGAPRFVLTAEPVLARDNYAQFVVVAKDTETRNKLTTKLKTELSENFSNVRSHIKFIQTGPPADYPIMIRVSGQDIDKVKTIASDVADIVAEDSNTQDVNMDWYEKSKIMRLTLDQDKLRALGVSSQTVAKTLYAEISGATAGEFYIGDRTVNIDFRIAEKERKNLSELKNLPIPLGTGGYVPLSQVAKISFDAEDGLIKRRDLKPTITVQADIFEGTANDATKRAFDKTEELRKNLPFGYNIEVGGALENSNDSLGFLMVPIPIMVFAIMTLLMFQLRNIKQMLLTLITAPLGIIGVSFGMLLTGTPIGFVADLGILALSGMIIRNSVILIDQIQKHLKAGENPWDAVIDSAILRFRPIMLTAAAAILGMIPLMASNFWGPMAVAIASGLLVATVLTLLVLPAMYAEVYNVKKE